jgi:hypothetical protein
MLAINLYLIVGSWAELEWCSGVLVLGSLMVSRDGWAYRMSLFILHCLNRCMSRSFWVLLCCYMALAFSHTFDRRKVVKKSRV